jgi:TonB family protein
MTEAPQFIGAIQINYPDEARKNGVEGILKASFTIAEDGSTQNIEILQTLPFGVEDAVKSGLQKLRFTPAKLQDKPVTVKMFFDYTVTAVYDERDKNITKPKITSQPEAVYPAQYAAEKLKGEVSVKVLCKVDGTVKVIAINSVMPREFDRAAADAAAKIRFTPATHKKSKKPVSQEITVIYKFKT